ncbi:MAG: UDP-N-acetylglucosamine--N-acetylmuramyl-(pentapeptide) pyrophosphoryl-undecaprenol N-acetylglucosamine transferase, partial [Gemmatimonadetes bacterium]|nr:UDP-N-acetylglucosamine--N-acetylmuramyl-(pentapeptide) pyrophosphoryl-undecaprenol N-acetylglucosamine transferase [Gemmatimonadota bacterium]
GLPAILVPLPTAAADHQTANARSLEAAGAAVHLPETDPEGRELTGERLWGEVTRLLDTPGVLAEMARAAGRRARPGAARQVAAAIAELIG